ncbi:MAG: Transcriptional regulator, TetR family protein [Myxococcales bacterium]|nr:Transcriptional regulator, TetR family protein [Myxococcales bacterium]
MVKSAAGPVSRQEAKVATREALIDAGMVAFGDEGLDASLDGICARAGFTRGAFYVHFRDRDDFLVAIMDRVGEEFLEALFAPAEPLAGEPPSLTAIVVRFLDAIRSGRYPLTKKGGVRPHQLLQACARSTVVRARYVALIDASRDHVAQLVKRDQRNEVRSDVEPHEIATLLLAAVIGAQTMMELEVPLDPGALGTALLKLLRRRR